MFLKNGQRHEGEKCKPDANQLHFYYASCDENVSEVVSLSHESNKSSDLLGDLIPSDPKRRYIIHSI